MKFFLFFLLNKIRITQFICTAKEQSCKKKEKCFTLLRPAAWDFTALSTYLQQRKRRTWSIAVCLLSCMKRSALRAAWHWCLSSARRRPSSLMQNTKPLKWLKRIFKGVGLDFYFSLFYVNLQQVVALIWFRVLDIRRKSLWWSTWDRFIWQVLWCTGEIFWDFLGCSEKLEVVSWWDCLLKQKKNVS